MFGIESLTRSVSLAQDSKETGAVTGRVLLNGKPAQGVIVLALPSESDPAKTVEQMLKPPTPLKTLTDADGRYRFEAITAGKYTIGPAAPTLFSTDQESHNTITVSEGATVEDINFALSRGGVITGKLTDSEGRPVIAEEISLKPVDSSKRADSYSSRSPGRMYFTDDRGVYRIFGLAPGQYVVSAGHANDQITGLFSKRPRRVQTFYPGVTDEAKSKPVEVLAGAEASGIDIKLGIADKGFAVRGRVLMAETGAPMANAMVAYSARTPELRTASEGGDDSAGTPGGISSPNPESGFSTTDAKGEFRFESLLPGRYSLDVMSMGATTGGSEFYADRVNFEVESANTDRLEIKVHVGGSISGVVVVENQNAPPSNEGTSVFMLMFMSSASPGSGPNMPRLSRVAPDGSFRIGGLKAGKITIRSLPYGVQKYSMLRIERDGAVQPEGIDIQANEQVAGVSVVVVEANGVISGRVVIQGGTLSPQSEISVWARPVNGSFNETQRSFGVDNETRRSFGVDSKGNFTIENLAPGDYEVEVSVNVQGPGGSRRPTAKQSVTVTSGTPVQTTLVLDLSPKGSDK